MAHRGNTGAKLVRNHGLGDDGLMSLQRRPKPTYEVRCSAGNCRMRCKTQEITEITEIGCTVKVAVA